MTLTGLSLGTNETAYLWSGRDLLHFWKRKRAEGERGKRGKRDPSMCGVTEWQRGPL